MWVARANLAITKMSGTIEFSSSLEIVSPRTQQQMLHAITQNTFYPLLLTKSEKMFVTSIIDEWLKNLDPGGCNRRQQEAFDWDCFIERQQLIWTPPQIFDKSCPRWLATGGKRFLQEDSCFLPIGKGWSACPGGCHKAHPSITLFFNSEQNLTVATISHRLDPFTLYLDRLVQNDTARCKTPLYYELDGYIRENLTKMRQHQGFGSHLVEVAMGALEASDNAQRQHLEAAVAARKKNSTSSSYDQLEEVLEICRLHRLEDDLDVMSIYCMRRTSKSMGRVASRIAKQRMQKTRLAISPLVDGSSLAGFSVFRRILHSDTIIQTEQGRLVEYASCEDIVCSPTTTEECCGEFKPLPSTKDTFSWNCEELSFANSLQREWGDIGFHEYLGQKLIASWLAGDVDIPEANERNGDQSNSVPLVGIRLNTTPSQGVKTWPMPFINFKLEVLKSRALQKDEVTVNFSGRVRLVRIEMNFLCLVRAYARTLEASLESSRRQIEESRPLLEHEKAYLQEVRQAASSLGA